jgi:hypothetical protein
MNIKNKLKQYLINPCNKCLVNACCISQCKKLQEYNKFQNDILLIMGLIIAAILLIICGIVISLTPKPFTVFWTLVMIWLIIGTWIYIAGNISNNEKWYMIIFIVVIPYLILGILIGTPLTKCKKNLRR